MSAERLNADGIVLPDAGTPNPVVPENRTSPPGDRDDRLERALRLVSEQRDAAIVEREALRVALRELFDAHESESSVTFADDDAPGHCHAKRNVWDESGEVCRWCDAWNRARALVGSAPQLQDAPEPQPEDA